MDQLNRGVQVEHLSLPPGITLTKVDPAKSEQLRQKSESIRKLSKPLAEQQQQQQLHLQQQQHQHPLQQPAHLMGGYYAGNAGLENAAGVIMVEANPRINRNCQQPVSVATNSNCNSNVAAAAAAATASGKSSRRRRRNRGKSGGSGSTGVASNLANKQRGGVDNQQAQVSSAPIMEASAGGNIITLRNPMFHQSGNNGPVTGNILPNPNPIPPGTVTPQKSITPRRLKFNKNLCYFQHVRMEQGCQLQRRFPWINRPQLLKMRTACSP